MRQTSLALLVSSLGVGHSFQAPLAALTQSPRPRIDRCTPQPPSTGRRLDTGISAETTPGEPSAKKEVLWSVPNVLSMSRIAMIPVVGLLWNLPEARCAVFVLAAITDWLDGFLARKMGSTSKFGAFLDPIADKLMVSFVLVLLAAERGIVIAVPAAIMICREIGIAGLREWMAENQARDTVAVGMAGKVKTAAQLASLSLLLAELPSGLPLDLMGSIETSGFALFYVSCVASVVSGWGYLRAAWPTLSGKS
mmetsp:Transcript_26948/g.60266  ORF Transcript_26948/g.60266 Transcript_26948/m.60266 type:complete len:252 (-) Transcript_26948:72-827(-)